MICPALFIILVVSLPSVCWSASASSNRYDHWFRKAATHLPAGSDWRLLKAQCWQESRLDPLARSPAGALGLCQFLPGTWSDMKRRHHELHDPFNPKSSIFAAAHYMRQMADFWHSERPPDDRYKLALASYNAGAGNLHRAQQRADGALSYDAIITRLPDVTGDHAIETTEYVRLIMTVWYPRFGGRR